jgi:tRNA dimethylallyltransferase
LSEELKPLVVIVGPTASGKTALSLSLSRHFDGEIVSCDSVAVYREIEIGTAKPTRDERAMVPHHMIDVAAPDQEFTAGEYARQARQVLSEISGREKLPIVVGGTGLYLRALLEGLFPGPGRSDELRERLRARSQKKGQGYLHRVLARMDRAAAERIHANDESKILRAVEVCLAARAPMTEQWKQGRDPLEGYRTLKLGLNPPREQLYQRINERARAIFERGLVEETRNLLERYGARAVMPLKSLGYRQAAQLIAGEVMRDEAIAAAQQGHRNYAKRQMTWFRREEGVRWLDGFGDAPEVEREAVRAVLRFTMS